MPAGTNYASDHFTKNPGDALEAHPDDLGNTFTRSTFYGSDPTVLVRRADGLSPDSAAGSAHSCVFDDAAAPSGDLGFAFDFEVLTPLSGVDMFRLLFRAWDANKTGYCVEINPTGVRLGLCQFSFNPSTLGTPIALTMAPGTVYQITGGVTGGDLTVSVSAGGSPLGTSSATDTNVTTSSVNNQVAFLGQAEQRTAAQGYRVRNFRSWTGGTDPGPTGSGPPLTAGTLSAGSPTSSSVPLSMATITGGTPPYSTQFRRGPRGSNVFTDVLAPSASASPSGTDGTVAAGTAYDYVAVVTDSAAPPASVTSNTVPVTTPPASPGGGVVLILGNTIIHAGP